MPQATTDIKVIDTLRNLPDLIPVFREYYEDWGIRTFNRMQHECRNYLSPNRREFYKILLVTAGKGVFTMGLNTYVIDEPAILFIHPNDIISWRNLGDVNGGYYTLMKKTFINRHQQLKAAIEKYNLFNDKSKSVIKLTQHEAAMLEAFFVRIQQEEFDGNKLWEDTAQAYLQLLLIESMKVGNYPMPNAVTDEFTHIHKFFRLLEDEMANINYSTPIRIKTAKEFAASLYVHPNYLNELLKKHTGQNVSTHIRNRLLDETKALLVQTDWPLQDIGYSVGFAEQPNFTVFFKKNTGVTPAEFRKNYQ